MTHDQKIPLSDSTHQALIEAVLPEWLIRAEAPLRTAYFKNSLLSAGSSAAAAAVASRFQSPAQFCAPLLQAALNKRYPQLHLDVNKHELVRMVRESDGLTATIVPRQQTLLEAALQNFLPQEAKPGGIESGSVILPVGTFRLRITDEYEVIYHYPSEARIALDPHEYAAFVRDLDLGQQYQAHFQHVFRPLSTSSATVDSEQVEIGLKLHQNLRDALAADAVVARMRGHIGDAAYQMLLQITQPKHVEPAQWSGETVHFCQLGMLHSRFSKGHNLLGCALIEPVSGAGRCLVYLPGEPDHPLKEYASLASFADALREKLRQRSFRDYFLRFVPHRSREAFTERLVNTLSPIPLIIPGQFAKPGVPDPHADIGVRRYAVEGALVRLLYNQQLVNVAEAARLIVVPTDDEDSLAREQRTAWWEGLASGVLNAAAFVVPGLGELAAAVGAIQLVADLCVGVDDWRHGQTQEAIAHFGAVAQNLALLGAGAAAGVALARSPFMEEMVPITDLDGRQRLLHPDLSAYASDRVIAEDAQPNALGQYELDGKTYVKQGPYVFEQVFDASSQQWVLEHPRLSATYRPRWQHNEAGGWQHVHEQPLNWEGADLMRRFGAITDRLTDAELIALGDACGVSPEQLREVHLDRQPMPTLLRDSLWRYRAGQDVDRLAARVRAGLSPGEGGEFCLPLLPRLAGWPQEMGLRLLEADGQFMDYGDGHAARVVVTREEWRQGLLARRVVEQLDTRHKTVMFPDSVEGTLHGQSTALAGDLADAVEHSRMEIAANLYSRQQPVLTAEGAKVKQHFPTLSPILANQLAATATDWELASLNATARMPTRMAEEALMVGRQSRLNQACEGLLDPKRVSDDRDTLAIGLLEHLPGWSDTVRVELRARSVGGKLLATAGPSTAAEIKYIVKSEEGYRAYDHREQELGPTQDLFAALCSALPDAQLKGLGLSRSQVDALRAQLLAQAAKDRVQAGRLLGQRVTQPWFRSPVRAPQGMGYALSGRGESSWGQRRRLRALYPGLTDEQMSTLRHSIRREGESYEIAVRRLEQEYHVLDQTLLDWQRELPAYRNARTGVRNQLLKAWRREVKNVNLSGNAVDTLPLVTADFSHISRLQLDGMGLSQDPSFFLERFPNVELLSLADNQLDAIPPAIKGLKQLKGLSLSNNRIIPGDDPFAALSGDDDSGLLQLRLDNAFEGVLSEDDAQRITGIAVNQNAMRSLARLKRLRKLNLSDNPLQLDDGAMQVLGRMQHLEQLELHGTLLELTPVGQASLAWLSRLKTLNLSFNNLGLAPDVRRLQLLTHLILDSAGIADWPEGLTALMARRDTALRSVILSRNAITEIPDLADLQFLRLLRSFYLRGEYVLDLDLNPLEMVHRRRLRRQGIHFRAPAGPVPPGFDTLGNPLWLDGCPPNLRFCIETDRSTPGAEAFYRIMDRVSTTAAYLKFPDIYKKRMWEMMKVVVPNYYKQEGDGLGVFDLRTQLFERATLVENTCGDGMSLMLDDFETRVVAWQTASESLEGGKSMLRPLVALGRQLYKAALVDEYAVQITQARLNRRAALVEGSEPLPALHPMDRITDAQLVAGIPDEVEIRLLLRTRLEKTLALRPQPPMRYGEILATETSAAVAEGVLKQETGQGLIDWLAEQPFWKLYLRLVYPKRFEAIDQLWQDVLVHFEEAISSDDAFSLPAERRGPVLAALGRMQVRPEAVLMWQDAEGGALRLTLTEDQLLQLYGQIDQGKRVAESELVQTLSLASVGGEATSQARQPVSRQ